MSKLLAQRKRKRVATVAALRHGQRLLADLPESKDVALGLAKGCKAESSKLSTMAVASHAARSPGCMGNPSAKVSQPLDVTLRLGIPSHKGVLGDQGVLAAHGRLQPWRGLQERSLGARVS
ncbi:hypothetical protein BHE74_00045828 [Ensete ventricosum]|nr:hypothetical protein BHE74_00045828 [Ensete ventricosum]